jgi:aryl-alcohol dehydrogenase-like predicted oxidoreductase
VRAPRVAALLDLAADAHRIPARKPGDYASENIKAQVAESVAALNGIPIRVLYFHSMDRSTPLEEQLQAMDELHKQGV